MYFSNKLIRLSLIFVLFSACQAPSDKVEKVKTDPFKALADLEWIDLSYSFDSTTLYWPNNPLGFQLDVEAKGITDLGYYYSSNSLTTPEHGGTHLDAPIHFSESGKTMDELTLDQLTGEAVLIDVSEHALPNSDYLVDTAAILDWESQHGMIPENTIVLFRTGYGAFYPDREKYFGTAKMGKEALAELHFPGISPEAASFLAEKRSVKAVGLDTPSLDYGQSKEFKTHQILMGFNIPGFENMANLKQLPEKGIYIIALPMKIKGGSGGPLRVIAGIKK